MPRHFQQSCTNCYPHQQNMKVPVASYSQWYDCHYFQLCDITLFWKPPLNGPVFSCRISATSSGPTAFLPSLSQLVAPLAESFVSCVSPDPSRTGQCLILLGIPGFNTGPGTQSLLNQCLIQWRSEWMNDSINWSVNILKSLKPTYLGGLGTHFI